MVNISIDWHRYEFEYAGEKIFMELQPLETDAVFDLMNISAGSLEKQHIKIMEGIFDKYVRNIENLNVNGKPATVADLANIAQLLPLAADLMTRLTDISNLSEADDGNQSSKSQIPENTGD